MNENMNEKTNIPAEQPQVLSEKDVTEEIRARRNELLKKKAGKNKKKKASSRAPILTRRRLTYGSISIGLVIAFVAAIVLLNMGVSYLTDRFYLKADITPTGVYEISDTSKRLLDNLDQDVRVHILLSEDSVINSTY